MMRARVLAPLRPTAVFAAFAALLGPTGPAATPPAVEALPVALERVRRADGYETRVNYAGRVVARRESELGFERGGRLEAVWADEGARVAAGDLLARLDTRELSARSRELEARMRQIAARLELARLTTRRRRALLDSEHVSPQRVDEAAYEEQALAAELAAARAARDAVGVGIELSELRAPYAGSITARRADEGSVVSPGQTILRLIEDGRLEVRVGVASELAGDLAIGSRHAIEVDGRALSAELDARVERIDPKTRTVTAIFRLLEPGGARHGDLARLPLSRRVEADGFWLPTTALTEGTRGLWAAYVVVDDPAAPGALRVERRQLDVLHTERERAFVRGPLREGERVVATGLHRLVPGQRVRAVSDPPRLAVPRAEAQPPAQAPARSR